MAFQRRPSGGAVWTTFSKGGGRPKNADGLKTKEARPLTYLLRQTDEKNESCGQTMVGGGKMSCRKG